MYDARHLCHARLARGQRSLARDNNRYAQREKFHFANLDVLIKFLKERLETSEKYLKHYQ
jgi:hypothetical protein